MKRELKHALSSQPNAPSLPLLQSLSRWKGNWNGCLWPSGCLWSGPQYCRAYPDEKGIETYPYMLTNAFNNIIAEPIPMKRELKHVLDSRNLITYWNCRAYPDEKGIETGYRMYDTWRWYNNCRAYPDEKGIETSLVQVHFPRYIRIAEPIPMKRELKQILFSYGAQARRYCRAYPDEKGIETWGRTRWPVLEFLIAEPIPMKRELKHSSRS